MIDLSRVLRGDPSQVCLTASSRRAYSFLEDFGLTVTKGKYPESQCRQRWSWAIDSMGSTYVTLSAIAMSRQQCGWLAGGAPQVV